MAIQKTPYTRIYSEDIFWIQSLSAYFFNSIESHMVSIFMYFLNALHDMLCSVTSTTSMASSHSEYSKGQLLDMEEHDR